MVVVAKLLITFVFICVMLNHIRYNAPKICASEVIPPVMATVLSSEVEARPGKEQPANKSKLLKKSKLNLSFFHHYSPSLKAFGVKRFSNNPRRTSAKSAKIVTGIVPPKINSG